MRITVIYLIVSMRLMGRMVVSQLNRSEMIAMVSLAAAIGVPLQSPDRGILAAIVIAAIVISIQQVNAHFPRVIKNWKLWLRGILPCC